MLKSQRRYEEAVTTFGYFVDKLQLEAILTDENLQIEWMNRKARHQFKKPQEFIAKPWHFHLRPYPKNRKEPCNECQEILSSEKAFSTVMEVNRDEQRKFLHCLAFPLILPVWETKKYFILLIDVTKTETAQLEMQAMQTLMHQALKDSGDGFFVVDSDGLICSWNLGAEIIFGYKEAAIIGEPLDKLIPLDAFDTFNVEELKTSKSTTHSIKKFETYGIDQMGQRIAIDLTRSEIFSGTDKVSGTSFFVKDVTPKRALQEQLKHIIQKFYKLNELNEHLYRSLDSGDIIQIILFAVTAKSGLDFDRVFLLIQDEEAKYLCGKHAIGPSSDKENDLFTKLTEKSDFFEIMLRAEKEGFDKSNFKAMRIVKKLKIDSSDELNVANFTLQRRKSVFIKNGKILDPGINEKLNGISELETLLETNSFVVVPMIAKHNTIGVMIADNCYSTREISIEDVEILKVFSTQASLAYENAQLYQQAQAQVSELKKAYSQLKEQQEAIIRFQKLATLGEMSAKIAHEIRNPLVSMGGLAKVIAGLSEDNPKIYEFAKTIYDQALNLEKILENLLNLTVPRPLKKEKTNIKELLENTLLGIQSGESFKECDVCIEVSEDLILKFDPGKIRQVFTNLILNALQAMQDSGKLRIYSIETDDSVEIHFKDTGPGISKKHIAKLFEPFYTTKTDGTGLGLPISSQIMNQHGGEITVSTEIKKGANIILVFPKDKSS